MKAFFCSACHEARQTFCLCILWEMGINGSKEGEKKKHAVTLSANYSFAPSLSSFSFNRHSRIGNGELKS